MSKKYFSQTFAYKKLNEEHGPFDVIVKRNCTELKKGNPLCEPCYIDGLMDIIQEQTLNKLVPFMNYQINKYPEPLQFLKDFQDYWTEVDYSKQSINYDIYHRISSILEQGIAQLSQPKKGESIAQKLIWRKDPDLFFVLFSSLYEEGFFNIRPNTNDQKPVAETLHKIFQVNSKIGKKEEYPFTSFHQYFKPTGQRQSDVQTNVNLKKKVKDFLKTLSS